MTPDRTYKILSARLSLNITEWGDPGAPPILLQHGGRDHARSWDRVAAELKDEYRVIAPDLRGHGDSEWVTDGDYHAMDMLLDFANVMEVLALPPCPIIGHSFGGSIAMRYGALYPERFTRFVNLEGMSLSPKFQAKWDAMDKVERFRGWIEKRRKMHGWVPKRYPDIAAVAARLIEEDPRLSAGLARELAENGTRRNDDGTVSLKYDPAFDGNPPVDIDVPTREYLWRRATYPLLLIYGAQSFATNPVEDGRIEYLADARVEVIEDAGHWVHHDQHAIVMGLAKAFLAERPPA